MHHRAMDQPAGQPAWRHAGMAPLYSSVSDALSCIPRASAELVGSVRSTSCRARRGSRLARDHGQPSRATLAADDTVSLYAPLPPARERVRGLGPMASADIHLARHI